MFAYEELKGSAGRQIWFRAPRYEARKLFPHSPPRVRVRSSFHKLHDISLGGMTILCSQSAEEIPGVGETVPVALHQSGITIFEANAKVCRRENTVFGSKLALSFTSGFVEFDRLISRNVQAQIAQQSLAFAGEGAALVPREYRVFCADVLKVLGSYRDLLGANMNLAREIGREFDVDGAYNACEPLLLEKFRSLWRTGNDLVKEVLDDREALAATKSYTETVLTPEFRQGAVLDRSYAKPLGYPGDFEVMNQIYDWERRGDSVYQMLMHRIGLEVGEFVRTRMEMVRQSIATTVRDKGNLQASRIMSLGSGPAREVELFLSAGLTKRKAEFTLIDQETKALSYAVERTYSHVLNSRGLARVQCLNVSFTDILRGGGSLAMVAPQDMIYCVGLIDYLADKRAVSLVRRLYEMLGAGGLLIVGNMNDTRVSGIWPLEFLLDWTLYYRTEAQMLAWSKGLDGKAWTETDSTDRVRLLFVRKP
jgi:extracellular factor (EF) 3-hydroxypalmitic acid methyl ester biosynthesis protein